MEITKEQKLARFWDYNINPITGFKEDKHLESKYIYDKLKRESNTCMDFIKEKALDRYYSESIK